MPKNTTPLALIALIAILGAAMAALAGSHITRPSGNASRSQNQTTARPPQPATSATPDPVVDVARSYAVAARNWTPDTYLESWERQIRLAGGRYRRALIAGRPGRREFAALREDGAQSKAQVLRTERDRRVRPPAARVLVMLDETTTAGGQTVRGATLNEVRLRRHASRWLVLGWTVIPGGGG